MFERIDYVVKRIDGDYAFLTEEGTSGEEEKCVARALLPAQISEGSRLAYEMMEYRCI
ncbi:chorismate--pyruvate lyase [bacterium C-53]|nr:chorismate--pyruvate lyase [Lachnospiraceae bacterium]NBI03582.1 chorismate--pyruvate lyase [Lachnospiraceae bacterium]RKJ09350.1 chorismate--pyruvate lyase [bacterium C-53]